MKISVQYKVTMKKVNENIYPDHVLLKYLLFENSIDPDQMDSDEAS